MQEYTENLEFKDVNKSISDGLNPATSQYYKFLGFLILIFGWGVIAWVYQVKSGMGSAGINHPVGWGVYITNFVFWVGIAHSGTLISAILFLVRSKWRDAVSRATEAMTVIAVMTAGLFPLIHLGRLWVFYYILPYPNQRDLYPNFSSPLVLDLIAIFTYLTVSSLFFYTGLIPDAATLRDKYLKKFGVKHWRTKMFKILAPGWTGAVSQWHHYNRAYMYFAMLATPLVISVHSVVSWDFAVSLLPGWHSTLFPPYFVAGAIHSGLAMGLTLLIPLRKFLNLKSLITQKHLSVMAKFIVFTGLIVMYAYVIEPFIEVYSRSEFHIQFTEWRMTGSLSWIYYLYIILNVFVPLSFIFKRFRNNLKYLFIASILINVGMWAERYFIIISSTAHDFLPHNWGQYSPSWVELSITAGTTAFFFLLFLLFSKFLPTISIADFKDYLLAGKLESLKNIQISKEGNTENKAGSTKHLFVFSEVKNLINSIKAFKEKGYDDIEVFTPTKLPEVEKILKSKGSPVTLWTTLGGIAGFLSGYVLTVGVVNIFDLIVGGKPIVSLIPFLLVMFELTVLFAALANFAAMAYYTKVFNKYIKPGYRCEFGVNKFGLLVRYNGLFKLEVLKITEEFESEEDEVLIDS